MRWYIGFAAAVGVTLLLTMAGATYPVLYGVRRLLLHLIGGH